jgi:hypothetical protein
MPVLKNRWIDGGAWRVLWVAIAICTLTVSLTTRYIADASQVHAVKSVERQSSGAKRQHLDRDAVRWAAPVASFIGLPPATVVRPQSQTGLLLPKLHFGENLYNRPPPSS